MIMGCMIVIQRRLLRLNKQTNITKTQKSDRVCSDNQSSHLWRLYIFIFINNWNIIERLSEGGYVLVFIIQFLFIIVGRTESFP